MDPKADDGDKSHVQSTAANKTNNVDVIDLPDQALGKKPEDEEQKGNAGAAYFRLYKFSTPVDVLLRICGALAACAAGAALPLMTIFFGRLVTNFNNFGSGNIDGSSLLGNVSQNALILTYLFIGKFVLVYIHTVCFTITANRAGSMLRQAYIEALLRQDISYFDTATAGSVVTSVSSNADLVLNGLGEKVGVACQGLAMLIAAFVVAFTQQWKLTLVTATVIPAAVIGVGITFSMDSKLEAKILDVYNKAGGLVEEALSSVRIITAFNAVGKIRRKYDVYLDTVKGYGMKKGPVLGGLYSSEFFTMYCGYALCFWYGIKLYLSGELESSGTIITVLFSVLIASSSITMITPSLGDFSKAAAAAAKMFAVLDRKPNIDPLSSKGETPDSGPGKFSLRNVSFAYPARPTIKVLDNVTLDFEAGQTSAIVGASGSGKSTIVALLERWYDPMEGEILLDDHTVPSLNVRWLRSQIGYVQQEPVLFKDTVYNNVVHGLYGTSMDELPESEKRKLVQTACIEANADAFIQEMPHGYDTNVGDRGGLVSGGQKQRIAIARSIVGNPKILLLDEATSALDPEAERVVQAALDRVSESRTTIMIAHKLSTVQKADRIVVMNHGKVIEQGTHSSLLADDGAYASLVRAQNLAGTDETTTTDAERVTSHKESDGKGLEHALTPIKSLGTPEEPEDVSRKLSLVRCLWIILYDHRGLWPYFLCGTIATIAGGAAFPLQAYLFSELITVFQVPDSQLYDAGSFWALMFFVLALGILVSYASIGLFFTIAAFLASRVYRSEYFGAMLKQDPEFFDHDDHSAGAMTSKLSTDPQRLQDLISANMGLILIIIVNLVGSITLSLAVGWKLALVAIFGCIPPLFFAGFFRMRLEMTSQDRAAKPYRESARFVSEAVAAIRTVSSLTLESKIHAQYAAQLQQSVRSSYKRTLLTMILFALSESLDLAANALAFWWGGKLLSEGEYSTKSFFIVFIAVLVGGQAAGFLFGYTLNTTKAHAAANHIIHLRNSQPPINSSIGAPPDLYSSSNEEIIAFKDVRFSYPTRPSIPVLRGLDLTIKRGQNIGIVGASGCGKTTIITLLERFYDITSGSLEIAGRDLSELDVHAHRANIGMVSQDTTIYQGSIRENILIGLPDDDIPFNPNSSSTKTNEKGGKEADSSSGSDNNNNTTALAGMTNEDIEARVVAACKSANIDDFILSLPDGYATDAGSHGLALSGGQRQRLAVARALIRDPAILLFDEATSALDTQSERVVQEALVEAGRGRTVVSVAHRLSTIRHCDCIFVIEQGRVAERGTHSELIAKKGVYASMVKLQSLDREVEV